MSKLLLAAAVIATGVILTWINFLGSEWFTRAGCLVVMLGIWSGFGGIVQERLLNTHIRRKRRNALVRAKAELLEKNADDDTIEKELSEINKAFDSQLSKAAEKLRLSVGFEEVSLVLVGTFIWGFGDLFCC